MYNMFYEYLGEMLMKKVELLAPAGSLESLYAAVLSGADAVYLGGSKFSARAYASNFNYEGLKEALDYCHLYGVKVYITLNTLIKEEEIEEAVQYIKYLYEIGVDALIIQDAGIAYLLNKFFPDFEVHASTQMTIHNLEGALFLRERNFKRIVLSRELSIDEIRDISLHSGVETEIFVHGALCVCYSGQCLMSSLIGGRSGNRGRCAQPCRLRYEIINKDTKQYKEGYLLSPKDMCTIDDLKSILDSGVTSLKLEGRMKRPEYVAGVVGAYKKNITNIRSKLEGSDLEEDIKDLLKLFNREGFTKAYLQGHITKDMMSYNYPKNTGILMGKVLKNKTVELQEPLSVGDGIRVNEEGFTVSKIIKNNTEMQEAKAGECVEIYPMNYKSGDILYKTADLKQLNKLSNIYSNKFNKKIGLCIKVVFKVGQPFEIETCYEDIHYRIIGDIVQEAKSRPIEKEKLIENLRKTGDTPFIIDGIELISFDKGFLPVSSINSARRELVDKIIYGEGSKYRRVSTEYTLDNYKGSKIRNENKKTDAVLFAIVSNKDQLQAALEFNVENIAVDVFKRSLNLSEVLKHTKPYIKIPNIIKKEFEEIVEFIDKNLSSIKGIITSNLGVINRFRGRTPIIGDYKLNIFNSNAVKYYSDVLQVIPLSVELNKKEIGDLCLAVRLWSEENGGRSAVNRLQTLVYGKIELMVMEHCPIGNIFGGSCKGCTGVCTKGKYVLKDRKGAEFVIGSDKYCRSYIYNSVPLNLLQNIQELKKMGVTSFRMDFIDESYEDTVEILETIFNEGKANMTKNFTRGHYKRGVE
jgi:U32 family peptidase